jgi:hypothetical protein
MTNLRLAGKWLVMVAPVVASSVMLSPAANAATFALSEASAALTQFNWIPESQEVFTGADTNTIATNGEVSADSEAEAEFFATPPNATNFSFSQVAGNGTEYQGFAASQAQVLGSFFIPQDAKDKAFSFDFALNLNLFTEIDDATVESANAIGAIAFWVYGGSDPNNLSLLDFLTVKAFVNTAGNNDALEFDKTANITLTNNLLSSNFGGLQESAKASINGSYRRLFDGETYLTLVEAKSNAASAEAVPEPTTALAALISGAIGWVLKRRQVTRN